MERAGATGLVRYHVIQYDLVGTAHLGSVPKLSRANVVFELKFVQPNMFAT